VKLDALDSVSKSTLIWGSSEFLSASLFGTGREPDELCCFIYVT